MKDRTFQVIVAFMAAASPSAAQGVTPTAPEQAADTSSIIFAPKLPASATTPGPSSGDRPVSTDIAAGLSLGIPAYSAGLLAPESGTTPADLRDVDRPRNQIPRLPMGMMRKYVVRESRLPVFQNLELYTKAGLIDLSFKEHPGLRIGNFFNLNAKVAYNMIKEDELYAKRQDLVDTVLAMEVGGDAEEARLMQQAISDASFMSYVSHKN